MIVSLDAATDRIRKYSGWYLVLGIFLVLLGVIALVLEFSATIAGVFAFGTIILFAGIVQIIGAFRAHGAGHVFLYMLVGLLDLVVGSMVVAHPLTGALLLTLLLSAMLIVGGLFRVIAALSLRYVHYGWAAVSGLVSCILGVMLWTQWPSSAFWFIGFCVGFNLLFLGASWIALASQLHVKHPAAASPAFS